jgi:hypothetical protein
MVDGIRVSRTWEPPLPVVLASLSADVESASGTVTLRWTTLSESQCYGFEVQRALSAVGPFESLPGGFLPGHGTSSTPHNYMFCDTVPRPGIWFYRLKQVDLSGGVSFSEIRRADVLTLVASPSFSLQALSQNYPNPFNPATRIRFVPLETGTAAIEVFTLNGARVAVPFEGNVRKGEAYEVLVDGTKLAAGAYFCRLTNGNYSIIRRMILLR